MALLQASMKSEQVQESWYTWIQKLPDPRVVGRCHHLLIDILVITFCSLLCGASHLLEIEEFGNSKERWLRERLGLELPNGIPSHDTFGRVLSLITPRALEWVFFQWTQMIRQAQVQKPPRHVAIDGKSIQGTDRTFNQGNRPVHLVSVYSTDSGLVLGQRRAPSSGYAERKAVLECLELLDLKNTWVTVDAASACSEVFQKVREKKGHYLAPIKKNLRTLWEKLDTFFQDSAETSEQKPVPIKRKKKLRVTDFAESEEKNRGRSEKRSCTVMTTESFPDEIQEVIRKYPDANSVIRLERVRRKKDKRYFLHPMDETGKTSYVRNTGSEKVERTVTYYLSNRRQGAAQFLEQIRSHWKIESQLHWCLDVSFAEDDWRVQEKRAAQNLATLRKMAFNVVKKDSSKGSVRSKLRRAGWNAEFLEQLIFPA